MTFQKTKKFAYDSFGNGTEVAIAGTKIISHSYGERNGLLTKSLWGNGWEISYSYDSMDRLTGVTAKKDGTSYPLYTQAYNRQGLIYRYVDQQASGRSCTYGYDLTGRLCEAVFDDGTAYSYTYDANDCLVKEHHTIPGGSRDVIRAYDKDSREISVTCGSAKVEKAFDELGRLSSIKRNGGKHVTEFTYVTAPDGGATGCVASIKNGSETITYGYDARGYVTSETKGGKTHRYYYDAKGQLVREDDPVQGKTFLYSYDTGGAMAEIRAYALTDAKDLTGLHYEKKTFGRGGAWTDQMLTVDGQVYTYDAVGNLLADGKWTYTWQMGNQLAKVTGEGLEVAYTYDASGIRTSKTVSGVKTEYLTAGSRILAEKKNGTWQQYLYDGDGQLTAMTYKGKDYYFIRDNLRVITGLVDSEGKTVVNYSYNSWGKLLGITGSMAESLGKDNPYRYKGYYYDEETGMYYLKSRYYNPEICRFISADDVELTRVSPMALSDKNLYAYCDNNPIMRRDTSGELWGFILAGAAIGAAVGAVTQIADNAISGRDLGEGVLLSAVGGAITGAVGATGLGALGQAYVSGAVSAATDVITQVKDSGKGMKGLKQVDWVQVNVSFALGAVSGAAGGNGLLHKGSEVTKARRVYQRAVKGIQNRRWSSRRATGHLVRSSRNLRRVSISNYKKSGGKSLGMSMLTMVIKKVIPFL